MFHATRFGMFFAVTKGATVATPATIARAPAPSGLACNFEEMGHTGAERGANGTGDQSGHPQPAKLSCLTNALLLVWHGVESESF